MEIADIKATQKTVVTGGEMFRKLLDQGDNIGALLRGAKREEVERGQVLCKPGSVEPYTKFKAEQSRMNFELAKELLEAGFPQGGGGGNWAGPADKLVLRQHDRVYVPTLSELIEACGQEFKSLQAPRDGHCYWQAWNVDGEMAYGSTPEEAVGRLWLALNNKV